MKPTTAVIIVTLTGIVIAGMLVSGNQPIFHQTVKVALPGTLKHGPIDTMAWKRIDSLVNGGLTESALKEVETVYEKAKKENEATQVVKALMYRMRLESYKEEQSTVKAINLLERETSEAHGPLQAILRSVTAEVYWRYYEQNRWRFYDRTRTVNFSSEDITTWDLSKIVAATLAQYDGSLREKETLKTISLSDVNDILVDAGQCGKRRPTLYDFLAHRAVDFFMNTETDLPKPSYIFQIDREDYLKNSGDFAALPLATKDSLSLEFRALKILQDLVAFHNTPGDYEALVDADLKRLAFVREHATFETKDSLYLATLEWLQKKCGANPAAAEVMHAIADAYAEKGRGYKSHGDERYRWFLKKALDVCASAMEKYPGSYGAGLCASLKGELMQKEVSLETEEVVVPGKPSLALIKWKNIGRLWLRAVPIDFKEFRALQEKYGYYEQEKFIEALRLKKPAAEWECALPDDGDYQVHSAEIKVPQLGKSFYVLIASASAGFPYPKNGIAVAGCWVSGIAYFGRDVDGRYELFVRDRETGGPLAKATVRKLERVYDESQRVYTRVVKGEYTADAEGRVVLPAPFLPNIFHVNPFSLEILYGQDRLLSDREIYQYRRSEETGALLQTFFFTDRAIYRPGQTVYFKGIVLRRDNDNSVIVPRRTTTVELYDVNYQKVSALVLTTNDYGTVSGSFIAPANVLNGQMHIQDKWGSVYFSVEEYKRPKFEVTMNPVKGQFRLDESIVATGRAKAYAGSSVDNAQVKYRVVRSTQYPCWFGWWNFWCPPSPEMEITSGTTMTDDTGGFAVTFKALPDPAVDKSFNPTFMYTVFTDITDANGETRSGESSVSVGYAALNLSVDMQQQVDKTKDTAFAVRATNMSGVSEPTRVAITISRLKGPDVPLRTRLWEEPDRHVLDKKEFTALFPGVPYANERAVMNWPKEKKVFEKQLDTKTDSILVIPDIRNWRQGVYAVEATAKDVFGQEVVSTQYVTVFSPLESSVAAPQCDWFAAVRAGGEPGEKAALCIGTAEKQVKVLYEIEHKKEIIRKEWLTLSNSQKLIEIPIEEKHRGNFCVHFTFVKNGRSYRHDQTISVPWTNKDLAITFETFRNKLQPGQKEEWRIRITGKKGDKVAAEMVACLYDASLDAFRPHSWQFDIYPCYGSVLLWDMSSQFGAAAAQVFSEGWNESASSPSMQYPYLNWFGFEGGYYYGGGYGGRRARLGMAFEEEDKAAPMAAPAPEASRAKGEAMALKKTAVNVASAAAGGELKVSAPVAARKVQESGLSTVKARTNLNETAFFYPHLTTDEKGEVVVSFTMPEALTRWKMLGFAHTKDLCYGMVSKELVTQKDLMVMPNLPRFLRENDRITLSAKITNLSGKDLSGSAQLMLFDATTMKPVDSFFGNTSPVRNVTINKGLSTAVGWDISVPENVPAVAARIVAKAGDFSDGEENTLPLVTNRMLVTETMPLPMRTRGTKKFVFGKLVSQNSKSATLRNHKLTLEFTQNPAWYAVQALPYLMEYPYECAEQTFARYYANTIATGIANSTPKIKAVFDSWKSSASGALLSNLEKNQELKSALLEEAPWVLEGKNESESKKRIGLLFDLNRMSNELDAAKRRLAKMQLASGGWPWFEGMPDDRFITQYIITGFGRLRNLKMIALTDDRDCRNMVEKGLHYLDDRISEDYEWVLAHGTPDSNNLGYMQIQYLYARSFFSDLPVNEHNRKAYDYYKGQAVKYWIRNNRYLQAMIALALHRMNVLDLPQHIIRSLKENSLSSEEMGMYWKEMYEGYHWYEAPIETQALYIEAFDEVAHDTASVEAMKVWLLKSKQTQNWKTTKATAEACYALLLRGTDLLAAGNDVTVALGSLVVDPKKLKDESVEAGTGYFKTSWSGGEIKPEMGTITVTKGSSGVAWGALYWQYFEQLDKITGAATPLRLVKKLFVKRNSDRGPVLDPVTEKSGLKIGDKITVRIELRIDRDMEYVHLKDMRAAGFEPLNVLSGYKWQDGLGYYESTRDLATHFFISYLNKGTYVFEYELVVTHKGDFSNGITSIQCMYAPEFGSHSEGIRVKVAE
ncbi:MAG: alpha-2-macroglobulin family protein [Chitinispirillaceae bacterium]|jgi:hypothetical protein